MTADRSIGFVAFLALLPVSLLPAQAILTGRVADTTGKAVVGAEVVVSAAQRRTVTRSDGSFRLDSLPAGQHAILFRAIGYRPEQLLYRFARNDSVRVNVVLEPGVTELPSITVEAKEARPTPKMAGFLERRAAGFGSFIDETILREREHSPLSMVLRGHVAGLTFVHLPNNQGYGIAMSRNKRAGPCFAQIFLDGVRITQAKQAYNIDQHTVQNLMAVEVYKGGASTPIQYGGINAACGTVLLWTRDK